MDATYTVYCDACPAGMGFWYPALDLAFYSPTPDDDLDGLVDCNGLIFYFEAFAFYAHFAMLAPITPRLQDALSSTQIVSTQLTSSHH